MQLIRCDFPLFWRDVNDHLPKPCVLRSVGESLDSTKSLQGISYTYCVIVYLILSLENNTVYTSVTNCMYKIIKKSGGTKSSKLNKIKDFLLNSSNINRGPKISVFRCTNNSRYHLTSPSGRCGVHALYQVIQRHSKSPSDPIRDNVSNIPLDSCHKITLF